MFLGLLLTFVSATADAGDDTWLGDSSWYLGFRAGVLTSIDSSGQLLGPTQSVYGGYPVIEMDDGAMYAVSLGRELVPGLRLEFELSHIRSESDASAVTGTDLRQDDVFSVRANVDSTMFMAKLGYEFNVLNWWTVPYIRGGVGVAETKSDAYQSVEFNSPIWANTRVEGQRVVDQAFAEGTANEFAWELAAGLKKQFAERWSLRLEYSYLDRGEAWTGLNDDGDALKFSALESQQILLGVDWRFH